MPTVFIEEFKDIELNNHNEVDEILGNPPNWMLKWGMTILFFTVIIFGFISWLIKYPDIIPAKITILTENPAIRIVAPSSGKIRKLFIKDREEVYKNDILAILDNTAVLNDIEKAETFLKEIKKIKVTTDYLEIKPPENLSLGIIQNSYSSLVQKINDHQHFLQQRGVLKKIYSLKQQIKHTIKLNQSLKSQEGTLIREVDIANKNYIRNQELNKSGVVSSLGVENAETNFLQYKRQLDKLQSQIINNDIRVEQLKTQIIDLKQVRINSRSSRGLSIQQDVQRVKSEIEAWKQAFLIIAAITGRVSMSKIWSEQQFVSANEEVFTIVPSLGIGKTLGKAELPLSKSGKVKLKQNVNIQLDGFPYQEYGVIRGSVENISLVPEKEVYTVIIDLPDSLVTTYDKPIPFKQEMKGVANIITEERRILERVFDKILSVLKNTG